MIELDIKESVYSLCTKYPALIDILKELGFSDISNPQMLKTVGRFMTIDKGAKLKGIPMDKIKEAFYKNGFNIK